MSEKEQYIEWAYAQEYVPITMMPWWLDAVCAGKTWDAIVVKDEEGHIQGAMPYLLRKRARWKYILMPQQSHIGGIWVTPEITADKWKTAEVCRQIKERLDQMGLAYYYQQYMPGSLCVDAMRSLGFNTKERITYRVDDLSDLEAVKESFSKNKQRQLKRAASLHAERTMEVEDFYRFHTACLAARKRHISYTREFLLVLERKARRAKQCEILSICDDNGQVYAAAFLVWDKSYMYFLIPTYDPAFGDSGAGALLALEAMKLAKEKGVRFDFEGSMNKGTAEHYRQFGSKETKYYAVEKYYKPLFHIAIWFQKLREWRFR
ncbi:MAG: GNAT family N-acetyltransferase [Paludibacteraceae bacterium]|nr:GNAT family N-acetyltransferase [Paludibacteraceae bacterium]